MPSPPLPLSPTFSGNRRSRLKERTLLFRYLAEINLILGAWYLQWRIGHSINFSLWWLAIPLLLAEIYSYLGGVMFTIGLWRPLVRQVKSLDQLTPPIAPANYPTVDIFVTCYNEPPDMVEQTTRAALAIDYPTTKLRVYVLDDGNSPAMRTMTQVLGLEDLQSPLLQVEVTRLKAERSRLVNQLEHIKQLALDAKAATQFLQTSPDQLSKATEVLQTLQKAAIALDPTHPSLGDRLLAEQQRLETAIHQAALELADLVRCRYIARPKPNGKPHHAKAGNINYAIFSGETTGDFILTLDADHIPKPQFLKRVLPYFYTYKPWKGVYENNRIALVQTPAGLLQFACRRSFWTSGAPVLRSYPAGQRWAELSVLHRHKRPFTTGSAGQRGVEVLFSRLCPRHVDRLDEFDLIGGMSSSSITEDMNTAMRLHGAGWQSVYHNELLSRRAGSR